MTERQVGCADVEIEGRNGGTVKEVLVIWLWLALLWWTGACVVGVVTGAVMRHPGEPTSPADGVGAWLRLQASV